VAGSCERGDEPYGSGAMELASGLLLTAIHIYLDDGFM
jgi:hypothetical protein